jgi:phage-related protein
MSLGEVLVVQQVFNQLLQFLQQGIAAIFKFVQLIWTFSVGQITKLVSVPWQSWPLWKQVFLVLVIAGVVWALYKAGKELLEAGERTLAAFAGLLGVLIKTLPHVVLAGLIALSGVWFLNSFDPSSIRVPTALMGSG